MVVELAVLEATQACVNLESSAVEAGFVLVERSQPAAFSCVHLSPLEFTILQVETSSNISNAFVGFLAQLLRKS